MGSFRAADELRDCVCWVSGERDGWMDGWLVDGCRRLLFASGMSGYLLSIRVWLPPRTRESIAPLASAVDTRKPNLMY